MELSDRRELSMESPVFRTDSEPLVFLSPVAESNRPGPFSEYVLVIGTVFELCNKRFLNETAEYTLFA